MNQREQLNVQDVQLFLSKCSIYRKKYLVFSRKTDSWIQVDRYLTDEKILAVLNADVSANISYFATFKTNFFAIDIDNHSGTVNVTTVAQKIHESLGDSSFMSSSPRGLHLYYRLNEF